MYKTATKMIKGFYYLRAFCSVFYLEYDNYEEFMANQDPALERINTNDPLIYDKYKSIIFPGR